MRETVADFEAKLPPDGLKTLGPYPLRQADTVDRFFGNWITYFGWDNHLMYSAPLCVPLPPDLASIQSLNKSTGSARNGLTPTNAFIPTLASH